MLFIFASLQTKIPNILLPFKTVDNIGITLDAMEPVCLNGTGIFFNSTKAQYDVSSRSNMSESRIVNMLTLNMALLKKSPKHSFYQNPLNFSNYQNRHP